MRIPRGAGRQRDFRHTAAAAREEGPVHHSTGEVGPTRMMTEGPGTVQASWRCVPQGCTHAALARSAAGTAEPAPRKGGDAAELPPLSNRAKAKARATEYITVPCSDPSYLKTPALCLPFSLFFDLRELSAYPRGALCLRERGYCLHLVSFPRLLPRSWPPGTARCHCLRSNTPEQPWGCKCTFLSSHRCLLAEIVRAISPYIKPK